MYKNDVQYLYRRASTWDTFIDAYRLLLTPSVLQGSLPAVKWQPCSVVGLNCYVGK